MWRASNQPAVSMGKNGGRKMKKTAIKGMSLLFVLFVVAAFATGVQAQDAADNENTTAGYAALGAGVAQDWQQLALV